MKTLRATTPVFTDESGKRATFLQWVARCLCACLVIVGAAIAFTLVTHVPLPGLGGLLAPSTRDNTPQSTRDELAGDERDLGAGQTVDTAQRDISAPITIHSPRGFSRRAPRVRRAGLQLADRCERAARAGARHRDDALVLSHQLAQLPRDG